MKNFRILLILVMLISTPSMDTNAQILSKILRKSAKTAVKKTGKEISQDMARKVIAKELGQAAAKKVQKISSKRAPKLFRRGQLNLH